MDPTQQQLQNRLSAVSSSVRNDINNTGVIDVDRLVNTPRVNIPDINVASPPNIQNIPLPQELQFQETEATRTDAEIRRRILEASRQAQGKAGIEQELSQELGIPEQTRRVQELTNQIRAFQTEALTIPLQMQEESVGRGRTFRGVEPLEQSRLRQNAIQTLQISSILQAEQGNLALAQQQLQTAIQAEFAPLEAELQFLQTAYMLNKDVIQREDAQRAQQFEFRLQERNRLLQQQKEERQNVQQMMLKAFEFGASPEEAQKIGEAQSFEEAINLGGKFLGEPFRLQIEANEFARKMQEAQFGLQQAQFGLQKQQFSFQQQEVRKAEQRAIEEVYRNLEIEGRKEIKNTEAFQEYDVRTRRQKDIDQGAITHLNTDRRSEVVNWTEASKSDAFVDTVFAALFYVENPTARRPQDMDPVEAQAFARLRATFAKEKEGENVSPNLLKQAVDRVDSLTLSSANAVNQQIKAIGKERGIEFTIEQGALLNADSQWVDSQLSDNFYDLAELETQFIRQ
jgi:hypothetical protein